MIWGLSELENIIQAHFILLPFTSLSYRDSAFFTNWRHGAILCLVSPWAPLSQQHFLQHCFYVIFMYFSQYFKYFHHYTCHSDLWLVISDVITVITLQHHEPCSWENLIDKCVCSDCSMHWPFPCLSISPWVCAKLLSRVRLCVTLWAVALQAPLSMGILQARILGWAAMPSSSLSLAVLISWDTTILKLSQLIMIQWPWSVYKKGRTACLSL